MALAAAVIPVVTPEEMAAIDAAAPEPVEVLIERAGAAVARAAARAARRRLRPAGRGGGRQGQQRRRRPGGRRPAAPPRACGSTVVDAARRARPAAAVRPRDRRRLRHRLPRRVPRRPTPGGAPVLAVDIPSGVAGLTGEVAGRALPAVAHRHVRGAQARAAARARAGAGRRRSCVADIGLDVGACARGRGRARRRGRLAARAGPPTPTSGRPRVLVVAGSPGMTGAAHLARGAPRSGPAPGMVRVGVPGRRRRPRPAHRGRRRAAPAARAGPTPSLDGRRPLPAPSWSAPGSGTGDATAPGVRALLSAPTCPSSSTATGSPRSATDAGRGRWPAAPRPTVLTPARRRVRAPGRRRARAPTGSTRPARLAAATGAVVLLKGPTTVVADPDGEVLVVAAGDARLATAGTGDVLAGVIGALLAQGLPAARGGRRRRWLHGRAARASAPADGPASPATCRRPASPARAAPSVSVRLSGAGVGRGVARRDRGQRRGPARGRRAGRGVRGGEGRRLRPRRRAPWPAPRSRPGRRGWRWPRCPRPPSCATPASTRRSCCCPSRGASEVDEALAARMRDHRLHAPRWSSAWARAAAGARRPAAAGAPQGRHRACTASAPPRPTSSPLAKAVDGAPGARRSRRCGPTAPWPTSRTTPSPRSQLERYEAVLAELAAAGHRGAPAPRRQLRRPPSPTPPARYDLVRCGIAVYGIPPAPALAGAVPLAAGGPARHRGGVREAGAPRARACPTGCATTLERDTVVATLPIGYADGVFRGARPRAARRCSSAAGAARWSGVVTMDQVMVDFGPDGDVAGRRRGGAARRPGRRADHARRVGRAASARSRYEVVCAIGARVERRYTTA